MISPLRFKSHVISLAVLVAMCSASQADVLELFTEVIDQDNVFTANVDLGDGVNPYGVQIIPAADSPFGTGDSVRLVDLYDDDKPELQGEFASPLLEPFRIDFQSFNQSQNESSSAIRFRMANTGKSISSEGRSTFSVSWQADGKVTAKYQGSADDDPNDVDTKGSDPLEGVQDVTLIVNGGVDADYSYDLFGTSRTLDPLSYDIYINGDLLNSSMEGDASHDDFKNGLAFHTIRSAADYDPSLGIQRFGLIGSSNSNVDPDFLFDNIVLRTGADIAGAPVPEPGTSLMFLMGATGLLALRRRTR